MFFWVVCMWERVNCFPLADAFHAFLCSRWLLKTLWQKEKMPIISNYQWQCWDCICSDSAKKKLLVNGVLYPLEKTLEICCYSLTEINYLTRYLVISWFSSMRNIKSRQKNQIFNRNAKPGQLHRLAVSTYLPLITHIMFGV